MVKVEAMETRERHGYWLPHHGSWVWVLMGMGKGWDQGIHDPGYPYPQPMISTHKYPWPLKSLLNSNFTQWLGNKLSSLIG